MILDRAHVFIEAPRAADLSVRPELIETLVLTLRPHGCQVDVQASTTAPVTALTIDETGIAWQSDVKKKFGDQQVANFNDVPAVRGGGTVTGDGLHSTICAVECICKLSQRGCDGGCTVSVFAMEQTKRAHRQCADDIAGPLKANEHFIVWMRTAVLPNFRRLWGKLSTDIPAGAVVRINIQNRYNTYRFNGKKRIVLSTASWLGGRNDFLGISYLAVGGFSLLSGFCFWLLMQRWPRKMGDLRLLSWNRHAL